ncbi:ABC transporter permease [Amaricoccus solimangrovi]|uniref:ABC transporter permease n=1 Tax=Amaricoccus solimangrovi TaxID=2589815 RepID=A0A501WAT4_9RHOB|nr:ABC transporter permease [Amaricoccus solimangrovi]TPE46508.1 ABC transporter permease [Amaricoccus solimangrovi]
MTARDAALSGADLKESAEIDVEDIATSGPSNRELWCIRVASIIFVLGAWEYFGRQANPLFASYPTAIARSFVTLIENGELIAALITSLKTLVISFVLGTVIGLVLGLLVGRYRRFEASVDWIISALYSTPKVAILPLIVLWLGLGAPTKIFLVTMTVIFPILINTIAGVKNVPAQLIDVGDAFAASERDIFLKIILPSAIPYMIAGIRLSVGKAVIALVVAEFFTAISGLGALITKYGNMYDTATMFVPILTLMLLGVLLQSGAKAAEKRLAAWRFTD